MFTAQEKTQAVKFPEGIVKLANGIKALADLCETSAHTEIRPAMKDALHQSSEVWRLAALWFAGLSGTTMNGAQETRARQMVLQEAQGHYNAMLAAFDPLLMATQSAMEFSMADTMFKASKATLSGFNWMLGYQNPFHDDDASTPFDEPKTVVGPHGDWSKATASLMQGGLKIVEPWRDMLEIYITVPVYNQTANHALHLQYDRFANIVNKLSRVWAMHIEVETAADAAVLNADVAAGQRSRGFLRTIYQTELMYANRIPFPKQFRGRYLVRGISEDIRSIYFQEFIYPLARTAGNGKAWLHQLVLSGMQGRFNSLISEAWMMLDAWSQAAFGFYKPLPDPTKFKPVTPDGSQTEPTDPPPSQSSMIPMGAFDSEAAKIAAARASAAGVTAQLDQVLASLRDREGEPV